jgi:hemoglobin-like flavoprotein
MDEHCIAGRDYRDRSRHTGKPRFQQRHYESVARTLLEAKANQLVSVRSDTLHAWENIVETFADMFARDNPAFKRNRFYAACAYEVNR